MNVGSLVNHLKAQSDKGVSHVYLDQPARDAIRAAIKAFKYASASAPPQKVPLITRVTPDKSTTSRAQKPVTKRHAEPTQMQKVAPESVALTLPEGDPLVQLQYLKEQAHNWPPATSLGTLRKKLVFSTGSPNTDLMLIGDAPGFDEELSGVPFTGRAGQKLSAILKAMGLSKETVYLTNICKFRPALPGQTMNNRKPTAEEVAAWMPLLDKEVEVIKPKCIIALGATAGEALTKQPNSSAGKLRGQWYEWNRVPLRVSYHPSYLLRNEDNITEKRKLWEDMLAVMENLALPISDKQRGFFKK